MKSKGRLVGLLFLATFISGATGTAIRGLASSKPGTVEYVSNLTQNASQMKLSMGLDTISAFIIVFISIYLFNSIERYDKRLAIGYVTLASVNFGIIALSNILHLLLVNLAETNPDSALTLSSMFHSTYYSLHFIILALYSLNGGILYYYLLKSGTTQKWIAVWGLVASTIVAISGILRLVEVDLPFAVFAQNGLFVLTFIIYLLIKGFEETSHQPNQSTVV